MRIFLSVRCISHLLSGYLDRQSYWSTLHPRLSGQRGGIMRLAQLSASSSGATAQTFCSAEFFPDENTVQWINHEYIDYSFS